MDKITLVITSFNPNPILLNRLLKSAKGFDEIILHIDSASNPHLIAECVNMQSPSSLRYYYNPEHLRIEEAYNAMIKEAQDGWICAFCDDDYFEEDGLLSMQTAIRVGDAKDCDIATFQTFVTGFAPWRDKGSILVECVNRFIAPLLMKKGVELKARRFYGRSHVNAKTIEWQSNIPAGAFFRKSAWEKSGGFSGSIAHDWILWLKMARQGMVFKFFPYIVYTYERRENSAWFRQFRSIAHGSMKELRKIVDREATI